MKLLTKEIREAMPKLYATEKTPVNEKKVILKLFTPWSNWTWFITEASAITSADEYISLAEAEGRADIKDIVFFGCTHGLEKEWGYVRHSELLSLKGPGGLKVERDRHWDSNTTYGQVREGTRS